MIYGIGDIEVVIKI